MKKIANQTCEEIFNTSTNFFHVFVEMVSNGDLKKMGAYCFTVYAVVKAHANINTGNAFPSINTLVTETGISERQVQGCLKKLEEIGYLEVVRVTGKSNQYTLKEKFIMHDKQGDTTAIATFNYLPTAVGRAMTEIKNFRMTGMHEGQIVHINNLVMNLQINNNCDSVNQVNNNDAILDAYVDFKTVNLVKKSFKRPPHIVRGVKK